MSSTSVGSGAYRRRVVPASRKMHVLLFLILISQIFNGRHIKPVSASIITDLVSSVTERLFPPEDYIDDDFETKTLNIVEISEMRARDIKRRLARQMA